jgi:class 3 adenylate cyclase
MTGLLRLAGDNGGALSPRPARIFVPGRPAGKSHPLPVIERDFTDQVYILGTDTVDFSRRTDHQQFLIFRQLLDALRDEELITRQDPADLAVLSRGDGVFVCFRQPANRLAPLHLALRLRPHFPDLRFGVNSGPATWILMRGGGTEVISHAVNWTARVMSAAAGNQVLLSDPYYHTIVLPSTDDLPETAFQFIDGLTTKHGEPLPAWEVTPG